VRKKKFSICLSIVLVASKLLKKFDDPDVSPYIKRWPKTAKILRDEVLRQTGNTYIHPIINTDVTTTHMPISPYE
jgi:hypothetical protein